MTGIAGIAGIAAGDAVLCVRAPRDHAAFLRSAAALLGDALHRIGTVSWAEVRNEELDLAIATTAHELKEPLVGVRAALDRVVVADEDGAEYPMSATYLEVAEPEKLSFTVNGAGLTSTLTFADVDGRTELTVHQTDVPAMLRTPEAVAGLHSSFDQLVVHLARTA